MPSIEHLHRLSVGVSVLMIAGREVQMQRRHVRSGGADEGVAESACCSNLDSKDFRGIIAHHGFTFVSTSRLSSSKDRDHD